jgi:hypothetical protein
MPNAPVILLPSAARTATLSTASMINSKYTGVMVYIKCTAIVSAPSVVPVIEALDTASGDWIPLVTGAAITSVSTKLLKVYPGLVAAANLTVNDVLPALWRVTLTHGNANSITYSVGASLLV